MTRNAPARFLSAMLLLGAGGLRAQVALNPSDQRAAAIIEDFERALRGPESKPLACAVTPLQPRLNFAFRHQAGYRFIAPVSQYQGSGNILVVTLRVTPRAREEQPVYLVQALPLRPIPPNARGNVTGGGGFLLGPGKYTVLLRVEDQLGRACRREWNVELKRPRGEDGARTRLAPGQVRAFSVDTWTRRAAEARSSRPFRAAILVHAAPLWPRAATLRGFDEYYLLTTLTSLLDQSEIRETSIVAFNLAQQREIFRGERLDPPAFRALRKSLGELELGTIDVRVLEQASRQGDFLARLVRREIEKSPDALIFIGPRTMESGRIERGAFEAGVPVPPLFGLTLQFYTRSLVFPDILEQAVKRAGGRTFLVSQPRDLAAAIRSIDKSLAGRQDAPSGDSR